MKKETKLKIDNAINKYVDTMDVSYLRNNVEAILDIQLEVLESIPEKYRIDGSPSQDEKIGATIDHLYDVMRYISDIEVSIDEIRSSLELAKGE